MRHELQRMRRVKKMLLEQLEEAMSRDPKLLEELREWLFESFGISVRRGAGWEELRRRIASADEVTDRNLAVFMLERGLMPDESAWSSGES